MSTPKFHVGQTVTYSDGREGHIAVSATVLSVSDSAMVVQFDDRADVTTIRFCDREWMQFLS